MQFVTPNDRLVTARLGSEITNGAARSATASSRGLSSSTPSPVPISFSIEPNTGFLRTVVTGRVSREEMLAYTSELRGHPWLDRVDRRLVDVRPSAVVTADDLRDLLLREHEYAGSARRSDRRAILVNSETGPALGRELVVTDRRNSGVPIAYRVFRSATRAYRYLRVEPRIAPDRGRARRQGADS